jgi:hypothetical protein
MKNSKTAENIVRLFGMTNLQIHSELKEIEGHHAVELGVSPESASDRDKTYYPQFSEAIRAEARQMAEHYEVFYCLEKTIRAMIKQKIESSKGLGWWDTCVSQEIRQETDKAMKREIESGVTVRSEDPLDYTTFGQLSEIITGNWDVFGDLFSSQKAVQKVMFGLNLLRGPIAHCSILAEDEVLRLKMSLKDWFRLME